MPALAVAPTPAPTIDGFLGGRLEAIQPADGRHRSGLEAVLLAAAIEPAFAGVIVDLGAGAGVAGLAAATRCAAARIVLVERDAVQIACARATLARANRHFAGRVSIVDVDITLSESSRAAAGLIRASADAVIVNPPFHRPGRTSASPKSARASAHILDGGRLQPWLRTAASVLRPRGRLIIIFRADGLDAVLAACGGRFGAIDILPIHPRPDLPAHRVLVGAVKGSRAGPRLLPPLALHGSAGSAYLPAVEAILRDGAGLSEAHPAWRGVAGAGRHRL